MIKPLRTPWERLVHGINTAVVLVQSPERTAEERRRAATRDTLTCPFHVLLLLTASFKYHKLFSNPALQLRNTDIQTNVTASRFQLPKRVATQLVLRTSAPTSSNPRANFDTRDTFA